MLGQPMIKIWDDRQNSPYYPATGVSQFWGALDTTDARYYGFEEKQKKPWE